MASAVHQDTSSSPFDRVSDVGTLHAAWEHVRRAAARSTSPAIRDEARRFEGDAERRIGRMAQELREGRFAFAPARGVAKTRPGKRPRPIVVAPVEARVVTRALLDVLLGIPAVAAATLGAPTSFGGLPGRGVEQAVAAAITAVQAGATFYLRSDIAEFFRAIPRQRAIDELGRASGDERFAALLDEATRVELDNLAELGESAALFPDEAIGVAQGGSLSTLFGNVLLRDFDAALNGRGITCLRYVDDFVLLGARPAHVKKAFRGAEQMLAELGLRAYDPEREPGKASMGFAAGGIELLGCEILGGRARPSERSRRALLGKVDRILAATGEGSLAARLGAVDEVVRGFNAAYRFCDCPEVFAALDERLGRRVEQAFRRERCQLAGAPRGGPAKTKPSQSSASPSKRAAG
jgi:hypothetical protein